MKRGPAAAQHGLLHLAGVVSAAVLLSRRHFQMIPNLKSGSSEAPNRKMKMRPVLCPDSYKPE
jgi:hypothetical protein